MKTIGEKIRELRKKQGLTLSQLGEKMGISGSLVGQYERGIVNPKPETISRFAAALGVAEQELNSDNLKNLELAIKESKEKLEFEDALDDFVNDTIRSHEDYIDLWDTTIKENAQKYGVDPTVLSLYVPRRGEALDAAASEIAFALNDLNDLGRKVAAERVQELCWVPKYKKDFSPPKK